jgi:SET domain-containing protein
MRSDVAVGDAGVKGKGVFARRDFAYGEFTFGQRHGKVVRKSDIPSLSGEDQRHLCELDFETSAVLPPPGCYLNHSCDPNAIRSGVNGYAWRDIRAGEEVTIDYRLNAHDGERWTCGCGAANYQGFVIGDFYSLDAERQRANLPCAPPFIRKEYRRRAAHSYLSETR